MIRNSRKLNFIASANCNLENNYDFQFAKKHALRLHQQQAIYTFIPKNACTTLRTSIAINNGVFQPSELNNESLGWVHKNSYYFSATEPELFEAKYTFTILRCPFDRLYSLFLDKFVNKTKVALDFYNKSNKKHDPDTITFQQFVNTLSEYPDLIKQNIHWRRQSDFLVYRNFDDYFDFSNFEHIKKTLLNKIGLELFDTRRITKHGTDQYKFINNDESYPKTPVHQLKALKNSGFIPTIQQMLSTEIKETIANLYSNDLDLYNNYCKAQKTPLR